MPDENSLENFDASAAAKDIAADIFGGGDAAPPSDGTPSEVVESSSPSSPSESTPSPGAPPPPSLTPAQIKALPKSWKKEMEAHWSKLPPEVHDYVYDREADVMRGIQMYKESADRWGNLVKPYEPLLKEQPDVNPVQLLQTLMNNHLAIVRGTPEQKKALAAQLIKSYGIDLGTGGTPTPDATQAELLALRQEVSQLKQGWTEAQNAQFTREVEGEKAKIAAFAAKPENKYFNEVGADMLRLIQNQVADSLESAYEQACWLNPSVRAKLLAEQQAAPAGKLESKLKPTNINGSGEGTPSKRKPATMDETIAGVIAKHFPSH
jgi:hypothetical protein